MSLFKINSAIVFTIERFPVLHIYNKRLCHFYKKLEKKKKLLQLIFYDTAG